MRAKGHVMHWKTTLSLIIVGITGAAFCWADSAHQVDCSGDLLFPAIAKSTDAIPSYLDNYRFVDGIPYWDYGGSRGVEVNPYQVAYVATLQLQRYCATGSANALRHALLLREWLVSRLKEPTVRKTPAATILRIEYDFPNAPYAPNPGWGSAFAQSILLNFALRTQPVFSVSDQQALWRATNALLTPIEDGGLYSNYRDDTIFWEEVASESPSRIVNAHLISAWTIDGIVERLPFWFFQSHLLAELNNKGKSLLPLIADKVQFSGSYVLYDLSTDEPNLRDRSAYAWRMMSAGYKWLISEGYPMGPALEKLEEMQPVKVTP